MALFDELFSLRGRHALIIGGGSGIGKLTAETLAAAGAKITIVGRRQAVLDAAVSELTATGAATTDIAAASCDITELEAIPDFIAEVTHTRGAIDILVNGAGDNPRLPMAEVTPQKWRQLLDVNLSFAFFTAQATAPAMASRGWGKIINIASLQSNLAFKNGAPYGAGKGGIAQLTRAQAREWSAQGVTVNAIAPGFFPTALTQAVIADNPDSARQLAARTAIGRNGELNDLRGAVLLLATPASDYITGQVLFVDGGFTAV